MKRIIVIMMLVTIFSGCTAISILNFATTLKKENPSVKPIKLKGKEVHFIQMRHAATPLFYDNVKQTVDSFVSNSYTVYTEGVRGLDNNVQTSTDTTTVLKKWRKILGDITILPIEKEGTDVLAKKFGWVNQPKREYFINTPNYKNVDINYVQLMQQYEQKYGEIILDSCDLNTSLGQSIIPCNKLSKKARKVFRHEITLEARDKHLAKTIKESTDKKILVMYGAEHYSGLKKELRKLKK